MIWAMSFRQDVETTADLIGAYRRGLQALRKGDRTRITAKPSRKLLGSANIDAALRDRFPQAERWDYAVACNSPDRYEHIHWIEVHPASGMGTISEVSAKLAWLKEWLGSSGTRLNRYKKRFVWIASGKSAFQQNSPQLKKLVLAGVFFAGGHYAIAG